MYHAENLPSRDGLDRTSVRLEENCPCRVSFGFVRGGQKPKAYPVKFKIKLFVQNPKVFRLIRFIDHHLEIIHLTGVLKILFKALLFILLLNVVFVIYFIISFINFKIDCGMYTRSYNLGSH